jgi:hypothetical protein
MDAGTEKKLRGYYEDLTETELLEKKKLLQAGSDDGRVITKILNERRVLVGKLARRAATAAVVSGVAAVVSALAAWTAIWFHCAQIRDASNQSRQPSASIAPTPSPSP